MPNSTAQFAAHTILQGADAMFGRFLDVTAGAQQRFEQQDWQGVQTALKQRIHFYDHHVSLVTDQLKMMLRRRYANRQFLHEVKMHYEELLCNYPRYDIAESFFNSIYCRLFSHRHMQSGSLFIYPAAHQELPTYPIPLTRTYTNATLSSVFKQILTDTPFTQPWQHQNQDIELMVKQLQKKGHLQTGQTFTAEMVREPFFRNKAAYIVGKLQVNQIDIPIVLAILNQNGALTVDACLTTENEISILFGFARSYFMVYAPAPSALVAFLDRKSVV